MNLARFYPIIFWNTANLIVDSAGLTEDFSLEDDEDSDEEAESDNDEMEENEEKHEKTVNKEKTIDYGKIATSIAVMKSRGISVKLPNINRSSFTFRPNVEENDIYYGIKGIAKVNTELAKTILRNAPYASFDDFIGKVATTKLQTLSLIKSGCFDELEGPDRAALIERYLISVMDTKKKLTMANLPMIIERKLLPSRFSFEKRVFNFNLYLKKTQIEKETYFLDHKALPFYEQYCDVSLLESYKQGYQVSQKNWHKEYTRLMEPIKKWIAEDSAQLLNEINIGTLNELKEKYASGDRLRWEMQSVNYYDNGHELDDAKGFVDFFGLPERPAVEREVTMRGRRVPLFKLSAIAGTVIDKNKLKHTVTLLTPTGVVKLKLYRSQFAKYDKQISGKGLDGKKKILESSWFTRGTMLLVQGIRRGNFFFPKAYRGSKYGSPINYITGVVDEGRLSYRGERTIV